MFACRRGLALTEAAYGGYSWHPQVNRYSGGDGYAIKIVARFDPVLFVRQLLGCAYLVGKHEHFAGSNGFACRTTSPFWRFLASIRSTRGRTRLLRCRGRCRAALLQLRDQALAAERRGDDEANRVGRDEASLVRQRVVGTGRADADAQRRAARALASTRLEEARGAAFGQCSLFTELRFVRLSIVAARRRAGLGGAVCSPASLVVVDLEGLPGGGAASSWAYLRCTCGVVDVPAAGGLANVGGHIFCERFAAGAAPTACRGRVAPAPCRRLCWRSWLLGLLGVAFSPSTSEEDRGSDDSSRNALGLPPASLFRRRGAARPRGVLRKSAGRFARRRGECRSLSAVARVLFCACNVSSKLFPVCLGQGPPPGMLELMKRGVDGCVACST